jgi:hypothetical protein
LIKQAEVPSGDVPTHTISFLDGDFNIIGFVVVSKGIVNIIDIACEFGIVHRLYTLNSSDSVLSNPAYENYNLTEDINFYIFSNVKGIRTQKDLDDIRNDLNGRYILMNDIELDETKAGFEDGKGWKPIYGFTGTFDGNNHKIIGFWINRPDTNYVGLFGHTCNAQIKNLGVEIANGKEVRGKENVGGTAGYVSGGNITNSYSTGNISGNKNVGGIVGCVERSNITNSYSTGNISGNKNVGGITGYAGGYGSSYITDGYSTGNISGNKNVGGIVGSVKRSNITNSYSTGNINGNNSVGGITGYAGGYGSSYITDSYSTGNISGNNSVGGITGYAGGYEGSYITDSYSTGYIKGDKNVGSIAGYVEYSNITNSYSMGYIKGDKNVGGIVGYVGNNSTITNSCSMGDIYGNNSVGGIAGLVGKGGKITNSYSIGDINGKDSVGGIAGWVSKGHRRDSTSAITNGYSRGDISGNNMVGGIVGGVDNYSTITNNAAINSSINSSGDFKNRIVGYVRDIGDEDIGDEDIEDEDIEDEENNITISDNFALKDMEGDFADEGVCYGISKREDRLKAKSTYEAGLEWKFGNDKDNPWKIDPNKNNGYPYLYWQRFASSQKIITSKSSLNIEPQFVCHPVPVKTSGKSNLNIKPQWRKSIEEEIERREIKLLVHFTRIENLPNILRLGLVPRDKLSGGFYPTDDERRDDNLDGNCLSITYLNEKMLWSKIRDCGYKFAFLVFDIKEALFGDYLSSLPKFFYTNSASNEIRRDMRINELNGSYSSVEAFKFMFKDEFDVRLSTYTRQEKRNERTPLNHTTDIQAEVVICDTIPPHYIKEIIFYNCDENDINSFCEELARNGIWHIEQKVYFRKSIIDTNAKLEQIRQEIK